MTREKGVKNDYKNMSFHTKIFFYQNIKEILCKMKQDHYAIVKRSRPKTNLLY